MALIIPAELNFLDKIEANIQKYPGLFDTNIFIPVLFYEITECCSVEVDEHTREKLEKIIRLTESRKNVRYESGNELDYFMESYKNKNKFREDELGTREYQEKYFQKLFQIMDLPNFFSIENVLKECRHGIMHYLAQARWARTNSKTTKKRGSERLQAFKAAERINKQRTNGMSRCLNRLRDKTITDEDIEEKVFYENIFSIIMEETIKKEISTNKYRTDQHLLANAFYLSAAKSEHVDIYTFDSDFSKLFESSARRSIKEIKKKHDMLDVSVNRILYYDRILIKRAKYEKRLIKENKFKDNLVFIS